VRRRGRGAAHDLGRMAVETAGRRPERVRPASLNGASMQRLCRLRLMPLQGSEVVAYFIKEELCRHVIIGRPGRAESRLESRWESRSAWPAS
jgi:hypothetical protein